MESKSVTNQQKFDRNRSKIEQDSILEGSGGHLGLFGLPRSVLNRFGHQLGLHLGSLLRPSGGHVEAMLVQKLILGGPGWHSKAAMMFATFLNRFGTDFGSILGSKMEPKIGPRSVSRAIMKQMQKSSKTLAGAVFLRMRVVENQSKIVLKTTLC